MPQCQLLAQFKAHSAAEVTHMQELQEQAVDMVVMVMADSL